MSLLRDLDKLVQADVISQAVADDIAAYYDKQPSEPQQRLIVVFGILGALLVGLAIILIVAHNWDTMGRLSKVVLAMLPLLLGQGLSAYAVWRKPESVAWREAAGVFLFCAVGASIAMISQIYHIPGDLSGYLLTWMLLCVPLLYVLPSSMAALMFIAGITYYVLQGGYSHDSTNKWYYLGLLVLAMPHYASLLLRQPGANFTVFHHWLVPVSLLFAFGTYFDQTKGLVLLAYLALLSLFFTVGIQQEFRRWAVLGNGYKVLGFAGVFILLLVLSFDFIWEAWRSHAASTDGFSEIKTWQFLFVVLLHVGIAGLLHRVGRVKSIPVAYLLAAFAGIIMTLGYLLNNALPLGVWLANGLALAIGVATVWEGDAKQHLGQLNMGLLMITALVVCRFFDSNLSFLLRGLLFLLLGVGFFVANYRILNNKKKNQNHHA